MGQRPSILLLLLLGSVLPAHAQFEAALPEAPSPVRDAPTLRHLPGDFARDQAAIWTSPLHMSDDQFAGGLLFVAVAGAVGAEDRKVMQNHFLDHSTNDHANTASTGLTGLFVAAPVAYYGFGHLRHDEKSRQTGLLAGEAIVDAVAVNQVFKIASRRERPTLDQARGKFFQSGVGFDSSFASNHSAIAWSSATVIASESESALVKLAAYGMATGVSATRVVGRDHFPSDVLVSSAVGWMIGRYVYHRHHRSEF